MIRPIAYLSTVLVLTAIAGGAQAHGRKSHGPVGRLFISPLGEPFRSDLAGDPEAAWFNGADTDRDGRISLAEFQADAQRWFRAIDRGHDGEIDPDDIDFYENRLVPEIRVGDARRETSRRPGEGGRSGRHGGGPGGGGGAGGGGGPGGGGASGFGGGVRGGGQHGGGEREADRTPDARAVRQGAGRYSYLDLPEPLTAADANLNRGIDAAEMARAAADRFALLDRNADGYLERRELPRVDTRSTGPTPPSGGHGGSPGDGERPAADRDRQLGGGDREQD